jgi:hypothetical protein
MKWVTNDNTNSIEHFPFVVNDEKTWVNWGEVCPSTSDMLPIIQATFAHVI